MSTEGGTRAVIAALSANLGIGVTKFAAWGLTGASSMLAEAIHSVADSGNQLLLLLGARKARREATPEHPFGFARYRYFYAFIVAVVLFSVGGLFALYEAWHKWQHPEAIESWQWVPVVVLVIAMALEGMSFRTAIIESNKIRGNVGWGRFIQRSRSPELPVILLEDFGALIGLVFAFFGVVMTLITDNGRWDAFGTAMIGVLLVSIATVLARETREMLLGESATEEDLARIRAALAEGGYPDVIHLRTSHLGPEDILVAVKVGAGADETLEVIAARTDAAEALIREAVPAVRLIFIEPDVRHEAARDEGAVPPA
ncbi:cation diffusion facilitator family transporter [Demequina sp. SYSU T00192]|uniref:Cation diffusion facilitator family transporter n=1 Tax=Demequina litoralis TaxID=3051660 RepID=A0ABT8G7L1_9MICO|nr:cation diffusion facilitator family transporter [Demequina sp. SYSU T00192]MDN4474909.1 cation diffusion facilitator family transporter [Demequina sp. SYSU T00192]